MQPPHSWTVPAGQDHGRPDHGESVTTDVPALLEARGIGVRASWGPIYGPVDLTVRAGGVTVVVAPGGRGRTALLLTLAGRMRPTSGTLTGFGRVRDAPYLFDRAAVADIDEVDGIGQTIRVRDVLTERLRWDAHWFRWVRQAGTVDLERLCRDVFGDCPLPPLDAYVEELPELTAALFRIAMANVHRPPLLVVGGVDRLTDVEGSHRLLYRLVALGARQTVVTADVNGAFAGSGVRDVVPVANLLGGAHANLFEQNRT